MFFNQGACYIPELVNSVADSVPLVPLDPGSGKGKKIKICSGIRDEHPFWVKLKYFNYLMRIRTRDPESFWPWIRDGKIRIRDKQSRYATLLCKERLNVILKILE